MLLLPTAAFLIILANDHVHVQTWGRLPLQLLPYNYSGRGAFVFVCPFRLSIDELLRSSRDGREQRGATIFQTTREAADGASPAKNNETAPSTPLPPLRGAAGAALRVGVFDCGLAFIYKAGGWRTPKTGAAGMSQRRIGQGRWHCYSR